MPGGCTCSCWLGVFIVTIDIVLVINRRLDGGSGFSKGCGREGSCGGTALLGTRRVKILGSQHGMTTLIKEWFPMLILAVEGEIANVIVIIVLKIALGICWRHNAAGCQGTLHETIMSRNESARDIGESKECEGSVREEGNHGD
jgi:hypothetical protein